MTDSDDIADVMREEKHRGRSGALDAETQRVNRRIRERLLELLPGPLEPYRDAISALHEEGTKEYDLLLQLWYWKHGPRGAQTP